MYSTKQQQRVTGWKDSEGDSIHAGSSARLAGPGLVGSADLRLQMATEPELTAVTLESPLAIKQENAGRKHGAEEAPSDPGAQDLSEQKVLTWDS